MWSGFWRRFQKWRKKRQSQSHDLVDLCLPFCHIYFERKSKLPIAHELQVIVPRLEIREITTENGNKIRREREVILSSVTVVSAPRREQSPRQQSLPTATKLSEKNFSDR